MPSQAASHPRSTPAWHLPFALAGMGLFGVSLAAGAWLFVVALGRPADAGGAGAAVADVILFSAFALHHSLMARSGAKAWLARHAPANLERSIYVWTASSLFLLVCGAWRPVAGVAWHLEGPAAVGGYLLQTAGVAITLAGASVLDPADLGGLRQVRHAGRLAHAEPHSISLSRRGPYSWVRHPIYLGWLLMTFAAPSMTTGRLLFALVSTSYLALAIPWEERGLIAEHGDAYRAYQRDVRWRMLPGIY